MSPPSRRSNIGSVLLTIIVVAIVAVGSIWLINRHDSRTAGDRVGDAIDALPAKVDKAADVLTDKSTLEKASDAIKDTGQAASSAVSKTGEVAGIAVSKTSEDIKAAVEKQKEQDAEASSSSSRR